MENSLAAGALPRNWPSIRRHDGADGVADGGGFAAAARGEQCELRLPSAHKVDLYPVQVAFEYFASPEERDWFRNLPTTFKLPRETVDRLRAAGRRLLAEDPQFARLLKDIAARP